MMQYNLKKQGDRKCKGNENMIRKNYKFMSNKEISFIKDNIRHMNIDNLEITLHAQEKGLLNVNEIKNTLKDELFDIIDYNYFIDKKRERYLLRTKKTYEVKDDEGKINKCYGKIVIDPNTNTVVTIWMNKVSDEKHKQNSLKHNYINSFDIINKKIAM